VLLDTHTLLWIVTDDPRPLANARKTFLDAGNELLFSAVVGFEIAVKYSLGKLKLAESPRAFIDNRIRNNALTPFPIMRCASPGCPFIIATPSIACSSPRR